MDEEYSLVFDLMSRNVLFYPNLGPLNQSWHKGLLEHCLEEEDAVVWCRFPSIQNHRYCLKTNIEVQKNLSITMLHISCLLPLLKLQTVSSDLVQSLQIFTNIYLDCISEYYLHKICITMKNLEFQFLILQLLQELHDTSIV